MSWGKDSSASEGLSVSLVLAGTGGPRTLTPCRPVRPIQLRDDLAHSLGGTSRSREDVLGRPLDHHTTASQRDFPWSSG